MIDLGFAKEDAGLDTGNVTVMLAMLKCIHDEVYADEVMAEFASTVGLAIGQLNDLQRLAYEAMIEVEAERATGRTTSRRKPN